MPQESDRDDLIHRAVDLLIHTVRRHHRGIERKVGNAGLHRSQRMILLYLSNSDTRPTQRELADRFDISPACVARALKSLTSEGYITRTGDSKDLRLNHVSITEKGLQIVEQTRQTFNEFDRDTFVGFSNEELDTLIALLSRAHDNLGAFEDQPCKAADSSKGCVSH